MARTQTTFELDYPPETVFDFIADPRNELGWQADVRSMTKVSDTEFDGDYKLFGPMRLTLQEVDRPRRLVFLCDGPRVWMRFVMDVAPSARGSRVTFDIDMRPKGALRAMSPLLALGLPREMAKRPAQIGKALAAA